MRKSSLIKAFPLLLLLGFLSIGVSYMIGILSENDTQMNVTGTGYEETYNSNVRVQNGTNAILTPIGIIIGVGLLYVVFKNVVK